MFNALKQLLSIRTTDPCKKNAEGVLFSESAAYFSNRVPRVFTETWVAQGGQISSGTTWDSRARYFFAMDPSEPWVTKLAAKSVMVIHAGWILHCADEAFRVPIVPYILDDKFVPGFPYKLLVYDAPPIYVPLSDPVEPAATESTESGPTPVQTSDSPSTPATVLRKRTREQAYFDSPSGSLVFSGFDKNGIPRRPRKLRKLRFDPSFSPEGARFGQEAMLETALDEWSNALSHDLGSGALSSLNCKTVVRSPDTPDKPLAYEKETTTDRGLSVDANFAKPICPSSPSVISVVAEEVVSVVHVRTIDFTNPPPSARRFRFSERKPTRSRHADTILSVVKLHADDKVKTPKKISFADHARVCVYPGPPRSLDNDKEAKNDTSGPALRHGPDKMPKDAAELKLAPALDLPKVPTWTGETTEGDLQDCLGASRTRTGSLYVKGEPNTDSADAAACVQLIDGDPFENDTLMLTMDQVQVMRRRLVELNVGHPVATLFELGKTFRGLAFRHVW